MARHRKLTQKFAGFPMFKLATGGDTYPLTSPFTSNFVGLDGLALDLQFAADKTLTARKGPTPIFTRGSNATVVGSNGLVRYAPNNAALYSGQLVVGTGWSANTTPSVTSIVDGLGPDGNNAYEIAEIANTGTHTLFNTGGAGTTGATSVVSGTTYTGSIFVKKVAGSVDWIQLSFSSAGFGSVQYANFNISNGTIGNFSSSSPQIQDAGNGWYRCSISAVATATTTTTSNLFLAFTNNTDTTSRLLSYAGNTANKVLAAMCQFEIGSTVNTYNPTTTAAVYGPRFDHNPVTLACKGLLIEESRTNMLVQSEDFGTSWSPDGGLIAISTNVITSPFGLVNADKITENTTTTARRICIGSVTAVTGTVYMFSCYLKAAERNIVQLAFGGIFGNQYQNFIIGGASAGTLGNSSGVSSPQITALADGWYRCTAAITSAGAGTTQVTVGPLNADTALRWPTYVGTIGSGIYAWGAQLEIGAFATSYIPTTTASVIRSADVCSITGSDFSGFYNPLEGTMVTSASANGFTTNNNAMSAIEFGVGNVIRIINRVAQGNRLSAIVSGVTLTPASNYNSINVVYKTAVAANASGADYVIDGTQIPDVFTGSALTADNLKFSGIASSTSNNTISSFRYYKKRLPVAKLQTITV